MIDDNEIERVGNEGADWEQKQRKLLARKKLEDAGFTVRMVRDHLGELTPWPDAPGNRDPRCASCHKRPEDCGYSVYIEGNETAADYVRHEEGTYDPYSGWFLCDLCYINAGGPVAPGGWKATPRNLMALLGWNEDQAGG